MQVKYGPAAGGDEVNSKMSSRGPSTSNEHRDNCSWRLARRAAVVGDCWLMIFPPRSNYCRHAGEEGVLFEKTTTATKTNGIN